MTDYLLIESRDASEFGEAASPRLGIGLARAGNTVRLLLIQNGVLMARPKARFPQIDGLTAAGVELLADEFSLRERGVDAARLRQGVKSTPLDIVLAALESGSRVIWH